MKDKNMHNKQARHYKYQGSSSTECSIGADASMDKGDDFNVETEFKIIVQVADGLFKPVIHRYLDLLVHSLRNTLRTIDFAAVSNSNPQVYIHNTPLQFRQKTSIVGHHITRTAGGEVTLGLGELSTIWEDPQQEKGAPPPYTTQHAETYYATSKLDCRQCLIEGLKEICGCNNCVFCCLR